MLAFYLYPFEPHNKSIAPIEYTKEDLMNPSKVEELFDYCQILEAYITRPGWEFLIQVHGYEGYTKSIKEVAGFPKRKVLKSSN